MRNVLKTSAPNLVRNYTVRGTLLGKIATFAVRDTGVSRHNGCPIRGIPKTPQYDRVLYNARGVSERVETPLRGKICRTRV